MMTFSELLQKNYDKLLHILGTFTAMAFACLWLETGQAVVLVFTLQVVKTMWNVDRDKTYKPHGDWLANAGGYALYTLYWLLGRR